MIQELYEFYDGLNYYRFCPYRKDVTYLGITYAATVMERSSINKTDSIQKSQITIDIDRSNSFAISMLKKTVDGTVTLTIYRNGQTYWMGKISSVTAGSNKSTIQITCISKTASIAKIGLKNIITSMCIHQVYSQLCGLIQEEHRFRFTGVTVATQNLTVSGITQPDEFFTGGIAIFNGAKRSVIKHLGTSVKLDSPFIDVGSGTLDLYPGCPLTKAACKTKFGIDNTLNFGGFEAMPPRNPFGSGGAL